MSIFEFPRASYIRDLMQLFALEACLLLVFSSVVLWGGSRVGFPLLVIFGLPMGLSIGLFSLVFWRVAKWAFSYYQIVVGWILLGNLVGAEFGRFGISGIFAPSFFSSVNAVCFGCFRRVVCSVVLFSGVGWCCGVFPDGRK